MNLKTSFEVAMDGFSEGRLEITFNQSEEEHALNALRELLACRDRKKWYTFSRVRTIEESTMKALRRFLVNETVPGGSIIIWTSVSFKSDEIRDFFKTKVFPGIYLLNMYTS